MELPSGTTAGPMTYMLNGKQFIVVSVGGGGSLVAHRGMQACFPCARGQEDEPIQSDGAAPRSRWVCASRSRNTSRLHPS
jgi:hypothetical protein